MVKDKAKNIWRWILFLLLPNITLILVIELTKTIYTLGGFYWLLFLVGGLIVVLAEIFGLIKETREIFNL